MHPLPQKLLYLWQQASDSSWSQCKAVLPEMISPCWVHSRGIPFECFFPPTTTKPCFSLSAHLSEYLLHIKIQQRTTKKNHVCTKPQSVSRRIKTTKATPICRQPQNWDEIQVWYGSGGLELCGMSTEYTAGFYRYCEMYTMERKAQQIGMKLVHSQDWDHNPCSTLKVLKLVTLIHHKLHVYKVKCPAKWDYSANNAVLDGAAKGHKSQWDDYVSQLLRLITRFAFQYLVIWGGFSVGMKPTDRNVLFPKRPGPTSESSLKSSFSV